MPTKDEIATQISLQTGEAVDPGKFSKDELEKMLEEIELKSKASAREPVLPVAHPIAAEGVTMRKVNRGSRRRLALAMKNLSAALEAFRTEVDAQAWLADDKGERIGDHPMIPEIREFEGRMGGYINGLGQMTPTG